jgi:hypothetical protein
MRRVANFLLEVLQIDPSIDDGNGHLFAVEMLGLHLCDMQQAGDSGRIADWRRAAAG